MDSTATFENLLSRIPAFQNLEADELRWLAARAQPFNSVPGQEILVRDRLPEYCFCVIEGRGRLLHQDAGLGRPITIALSRPGDLVGWAGLVRRHPCEWFTAADSMKLIGFKADDFYELEKQSEAFRRWLDSQTSPAEFIQVLQPTLSKRAVANPPEREVLRRLLPYMDVVTTDTLRQLPDSPGVLWFWNCQASGHSFRVGEPVSAEQLADIPQGVRLRLLRCSEEAWARELTSHPEVLPTEDQRPSGILDPGHRYEDMLVPEPSGQSVGLTESDSPSTLRLNGRSIPVVTGVGPVQQTLACLEMLALIYGVPFRRDVVERACSDTLHSRPATLEVVGNLSTILGFTGQICTVPEAQVARLPFPCFTIYCGQPVILHDFTAGKIKAVLPEYGPHIIDLEDIFMQAGCLK